MRCSVSIKTLLHFLLSPPILNTRYNLITPKDTPTIPLTPTRSQRCAISFLSFSLPHEKSKTHLEGKTAGTCRIYRYFLDEWQMITFISQVFYLLPPSTSLVVFPFTSYLLHFLYTSTSHSLKYIMPLCLLSVLVHPFSSSGFSGMSLLMDDVRLLYRLLPLPITSSCDISDEKKKRNTPRPPTHVC